MSRPKFTKTGNRFIATYRFMKDPFACYRRWQQKFGDTFMVRALNDAPKKESLYRRNITMAPKSGIPLKFVGKRKAVSPDLRR